MWGSKWFFVVARQLWWFLYPKKAKIELVDLFPLKIEESRKCLIMLPKISNQYPSSFSQSFGRIPSDTLFPEIINNINMFNLSICLMFIVVVRVNLKENSYIDWKIELLYLPTHWWTKIKSLLHKAVWLCVWNDRICGRIDFVFYGSTFSIVGKLGHQTRGIVVKVLVDGFLIWVYWVWFASDVNFHWRRIAISIIPFPYWLCKILDECVVSVRALRRLNLHQNAHCSFSISEYLSPA